MPRPESSRQNLEKARAKWRPPRPWRSAEETRVIKLLAWQWFNHKGSGNWSCRAFARRLGVAHKYVQKLARQFRNDPAKMTPYLTVFGEASLAQLMQAQQETQRQRQLGWLRNSGSQPKSSFSFVMVGMDGYFRINR